MLRKIMKRLGIFLLFLVTLSGGYFVFHDLEHLELNSDTRSQLGGTYALLSKGVTHYQIKGSAGSELVVLVHGYGVASYVWEPTFNFLVENGYQVLRLDLYGHGYSDRPDAVYGVSLFSDQIGELLDYLNIDEPFHLIGLSMGGSIVTHFAHQNPEKLRSLILQDPLVKKIGLKNIFPLDLPGIGEYLTNVYLMPRNIHRQKDRAEKTPSYEPYGKKYIEQAKYIGFRKAILSALRFMAAHDYAAENRLLAKTTTPKLLIWGSEDRTIPIENAKILTDLMPDIQFEIIDGAGHVPSREVPEKFNSILLNWLHSLDKPDNLSNNILTDSPRETLQ